METLSDKQTQDYAQQLAGNTPLRQVKPGVYTAKLSDGTILNLRSVSTSADKTGARWTLDIKRNADINDLANKYQSGIEIKFR